MVILNHLITPFIFPSPRQTLARKVGDQWVLNDPPPDPALELLKCQRYFWRMSGKWIPAGIGVAVSATQLHVQITYPVPFRSTPAIAFNKLYINGVGALSNSAIPVTKYIIGENDNGRGWISIDCAGGLQVGACYFVSSRENTDAYLEFSAEL